MLAPIVIAALSEDYFSRNLENGGRAKVAGFRPASGSLRKAGRPKAHSGRVWPRAARDSTLAPGHLLLAAPSPIPSQSIDVSTRLVIRLEWRPVYITSFVVVAKILRLGSSSFE